MSLKMSLCLNLWPAWSTHQGLTRCGSHSNGHRGPRISSKNEQGRDKYTNSSFSSVSSTSKCHSSLYLLYP